MNSKNIIDDPHLPSSWTLCFAVPSSNSIIDLCHPVTLRSQCYNQTLDEVRGRYPGAEIISLDSYCKAKAAQQDAPFTWEKTDRETYWNMLECVPPAFMGGGAFLVGEPMDHHAITGHPRFQAFIQRGNRYLTSSRPLTIAELKAALSSQYASCS